jgi:hypothetical protein
VKHERFHVLNTDLGIYVTPLPLPEEAEKQIV